MKIDYISDIHLEFFNSRVNKSRSFSGYIQKFPLWNNTDSEVLILAGDICNISEFLSGSNFDFFDHIAEQYQKIIWVFGNHEYYGTSLCENTTKAVQDTLEDRYGNKFYATNLGVLEYKDVTFVCATLWTDYDKNNPMSMLHSQLSMPDCRMISDSINDMVTPKYIYNEHKKSVNLIENVLSDSLHLNTTNPIVVVTHHLPSYNSISKKYANSNLNPAFASDLNYMFLITDNLKYWIHGHTHDSCDYLMGTCNIVCNPHGYIGYEVDDNEFVIKSIDV